MIAKQGSFEPDWVVHPGQVLEEWLEENEMTQSELARRLGVSLKHVNGIVRGHCLYSAELAIGLERVTGITARLWMIGKARYELGLAQGKTVIR